MTDIGSGRSHKVRIPYSYSEKKQKSFSFPLPDLSELPGKHRILLEFESIAGDIEIKIDNRRVALFRSSSFEKQQIDITAAVTANGKHFVEVITAPPDSKDAFISQGFRWGNFKYGILGNTFLRLEPYIVTETVKIETSVRDEMIRVIGWVHNYTGSSCDLKWSPRVVLDGDCKLVLPAKRLQIRSGETVKVTTEAKWNDPELWGYGEYGKPLLYTLETDLTTTVHTIDTRRDRFGFREIWIDGDKILFNGKPVFFRFGLLGPMYGSHREYFATLFKAYRAINFDALRFSLEYHNNGQSLFNLADETGFLLKPMFYLGHGKVFHHTHQLTEAEKQELIRLYRKTIRNYWNHPSLMWIYVDNEFASSGEKNRLKLRDIALACREEDPTRILDHGGDLALMLSKNNGTYPELETWSVRSGGKDYIGKIRTTLKDYNYQRDIPLLNDEIYAGGFLFDDNTSIPFFLQNSDIVAAHTAQLGDFYAQTIKGLYELGFQSVGPCYGGGPFFTYIQPGKPVRFPLSFIISNPLAPIAFKLKVLSGVSFPIQ